MEEVVFEQAFYKYLFVSQVFEIVLYEITRIISILYPWMQVIENALEIWKNHISIP